MKQVSAAAQGENGVLPELLRMSGASAVAAGGSGNASRLFDVVEYDGPNQVTAKNLYEPQHRRWSMRAFDGEGLREIQTPGNGMLAILYRRAVEESRGPADPSMAAARNDGKDPAKSRAEMGGLTELELDLAVRRDSRRYDSGMSIY